MKLNKVRLLALSGTTLIQGYSSNAYAGDKPNMLPNSITTLSQISNNDNFNKLNSMLRSGTCKDCNVTIHDKANTALKIEGIEKLPIIVSNINPITGSATPLSITTYSAKINNHKATIVQSSAADYILYNEAGKAKNITLTNNSMSTVVIEEPKMRQSVVDGVPEDYALGNTENIYSLNTPGTLKVLVALHNNLGSTYLNDLTGSVESAYFYTQFYAKFAEEIAVIMKQNIQISLMPLWASGSLANFDYPNINNLYLVRNRFKDLMKANYPELVKEYDLVQMLGGVGFGRGVIGVAELPGKYSVATINSSWNASRTPAHELGHNLTAEHIYGGLIYVNGKICNDFMARGNLIEWSCDRFSNKNRQVVGKYLFGLNLASGYQIDTWIQDGSNSNAIYFKKIENRYLGRIISNNLKYYNIEYNGVLKDRYQHSIQPDGKIKINLLDFNGRGFEAGGTLKIYAVVESTNDSPIPSTVREIKILDTTLPLAPILIQAGHPVSRDSWIFDPVDGGLQALCFDQIPSFVFDNITDYKVEYGSGPTITKTIPKNSPEADGKVRISVPLYNSGRPFRPGQPLKIWAITKQGQEVEVLNTIIPPGR